MRSALAMSDAFDNSDGGEEAAGGVFAATDMQSY